VVPEVSLATVYNALNELVAMGEITEVRPADGSTR
jgi:Fe2+ or Zn2+ uptake regulation protein